MGVWDRDYARTRPDEERRTRRRARVPPPGALTLLAVHLFGIVMVTVMRHDAGPQAADVFRLEGNTSHLAAIALHPIGTHSWLAFAFVVLVIWMLGARVERRLGPGHLLALYVAGTLIAGSFYFAFAQVAPELAEYALVIPAGGLAAWVLAARRSLVHETVALLGHSTTTATAATVGAAIVAGCVFFWGGPGATGWLLAAVAGSLASPASRLIRGEVGTATRSRRPRRQGVERAAPEEPAIDDILTKISREGLDALTPAERDRLEAARRAKQRPSP
jgi:membrane associated rhomboid family serine protease